MLERFDCYSPGARRLYHFEAHAELQLLAAEIRRTLDAIAAASSARIDKGELTRQDAERQALLWLAIAEDLETLSAVELGPIDAKLRDLRQKNGVAWADKVRALRREIEARRTAYPAEVAKGRLTSDQAKDRLDAIEAVHDLYWRHGYAFDGTRADLRAMSGPVLDSYEFTQPSEAAAA